MQRSLLWPALMVCFGVAYALDVNPRYEKGPQTILLLDMVLQDGLLQKSNKERAPLIFQIAVEDGHCSRLVLVNDAIKEWQNSTLKYSDKDLSGSVTLRLRRGRPESVDTRTLIVETSIQGNEVAGTYHLAENPGEQGSLKGRQWTEQELAAVHAIPSNTDWPSWLGPQQSFSAVRTDSELIQDLRQAKLLWRSEFISNAETHRVGLSSYRDPPAGGYSPILYRGRLYQSSYRVSGERVYARFEKDKAVAEEASRKLAKPLEQIRKNWLIEADDVFTCIEAATGKTIWRTIIPGVGRNWPAHKSALTNWTPVAHDGKIYALGSTAILYCLDAQSGTVIWYTPVPKMHAKAMDYRDKGLEGLGGRESCMGLNIVAGVVLAPGSERGAPLQGIDAATGKPLWEHKAGAAHRVTPLRWTHENKEYVIVVGDDRIACLEPQSGKALWEQLGISGDTQPGFYKDLIVVDTMPETRRKEFMAAVKTDQKFTQCYGHTTCFRLTPAGAQQVWQLDQTYGRSLHKGYAVAEGILFLRSGTPEKGFTALDITTGKVLYEEPGHKNSTECHAFWMNGRYIAEPDSQHDTTDWMFYLAKPGEIRRLPPSDTDSPGHGRPVAWHPPHPHTTTYGTPISHAAADGRVFVRGQDGIYCYDLRRREQK